MVGVRENGVDRLASFKGHDKLVFSEEMGTITLPGFK